MTKIIFKRYWLISWAFAILFGEIITGLISHNPMFFQHWFAISLYYGVLTLIFSSFVTRLPVKVSLLIFFAYGVLVELYLFRNIKGWDDIVGIIFFGLLYVFLFGIPVLFARKKLS